MGQDTQSEPAQEAPRSPITPLEDFKTAAAELRRPFTANAVRWKIQSTWGGQPPKGALIVAYIDARLVIERLNALVPHLWSATFEPLEGHRDYLRCHLTIGSLTRTDVGTGGDPKARQSDALKRAAVHFGVGVSLYAIPRMILHSGAGEDQVRLQGAQGKKRPIIDDKTERYLRSMYGSWLEVSNTFGEPLDHGDVEGAVGDVDAEVPAGAEVAPDESGPSDDAGKALEVAIWEAYDELPPNGRKGTTRASIEAMIANTVSHDELEAVLNHVRTLERETTTP